MQRMRREGVEGAPGLVPWRGKGRSGTSVFAWCLSEFVETEYIQPNDVGVREVIRSNPGASVYQNQGDQSFEGDQEMSKDRESMYQGGRRIGMSGRQGPRGMWCRRRQRAPHDVGELCTSTPHTTRGRTARARIARARTAGVHNASMGNASAQ